MIGHFADHVLIGQSNFIRYYSNIDFKNLEFIIRHSRQFNIRNRLIRFNLDRKIKSISIAYKIIMKIFH